MANTSQAQANRWQNRVGTISNAINTHNPDVRQQRKKCGAFRAELDRQGSGRA